MIRNYYTLLHVAAEINKLGGNRVLSCFSQEKDSLVIEIPVQDVIKYIIFRSDGKYDSVYITDRYNRAKKNTVDLLPDIVDEVLISAKVIANNRIVKLELCETNVYFQLFGGKNSNVYLTNQQNIIFDSFKDSDENFGKKYIIKSEVLPDFLSMPSNMNIINAIAGSNLLFGKFYAEIICYKLNISTELQIGELNTVQLKSLVEYCDKFKENLINAYEFFVLSLSEIDYHLSLYNYEKAECIFKSVSVSYSIRKFIFLELKTNNFEKLFAKISEKFIIIEERQKKKVALISDFSQTESKLLSYKKYADLLMSQTNLRIKSGSVIKLTDWEGNSLTVPLDEKLNLMENANKYYNKIKKLESDIVIRKKRLPSEFKKLEKICDLINQLSEITEINSLLKFIEQNNNLPGKNIVEQEIKIKESKFRVFELGEGYQLFVGKNAANNDELTMKFAKPNDLWLHARGTSGSHAVVRLAKEEKPPKYVLMKAAEITAYYSGARNAKYVPVIYTFKKYVRKPKGSNIGSVIVSKETVVMAEPKLPAGDSD
jgi:predicted ribosome quality control (RQC) complex YloA/Tae2 family protein